MSTHVPESRRRGARRAATPLAAAVLLLGAGCRRAGEAPASGPALEVRAVGFGTGRVELHYQATHVGSETCGECHPRHRDLARGHNMALTARRLLPGNADQWFSPALLRAPVRWPPEEGTPAPRWRRDGASVHLEAQNREGVASRAEVSAVFGSGRHGFTPISAAAGRGIRELRLSLLGPEKAWQLTPGDGGDPDPVGYVRSAEMSEACLSCHTTVLAWRGDRLDLDATVFGIGCERCHGPGSAHLEAVQAGSDDLRVFNPGRLTAAAEVAFCGQCHRRPADIEPAGALGRGGDVARHAGAGLMLSACFRRSPPESTIHCRECHDPHRNTDPGRDPFNRACLRCHARPEESHRSQPIAASADCVSCHMPVETKGFFGLSFRDHWIRSPGSPPPNATAGKDELRRLLEASYLEGMARPGIGGERAARLRTRLGKLHLLGGEEELGLARLREALEFAPLYSDRIIAAEAHLKFGRRLEAAGILREAIRREPEHNRAYYTLARLHAAAGDLALAEGVLREWEKARPGDPALADARRELLPRQPAR